MNKELKKHCWMLILACFFVYTATICIKMVYSSEIVEIINKFGESKARVGIGLTSYYITYAISQLSLAPFVKKINIGKLMVVTLTISAILYGIIPFTTELYQIWIILGINGILHASCFGGCMFYFGKYLPPELNGPACSTLTIGFIGGTVVSYVIAPIFIRNGIWQYAFLLFAAILFVSVFVFIFVERKVEKVFKKYGIDTDKRQEAKKASAETGRKKNNTVTAVVILMAASALVINTAYYMITNWFPAYLKDVFLMDPVYSVVVTIILYIASFIVTNLSIIICDKNRQKQPLASILKLSSVIALTVSFVQVFSYNVGGLILAVVLSTIVLSFVRNNGTLMSSYMVLELKDFVNAASLTMITNAAASLGAAIGPTAAGFVTDNFGWGAYFIFMAAVLAISLVIVFAATVFYKRLKVREEKNYPN